MPAAATAIAARAARLTRVPSRLAASGAIPGLARTGLSSCPDRADDSDDLPQDDGVVCRDRLVCRVVRHQPGVAADPLQRLHRGLIGRGPVQLGGDDLAVLRRVLLPDHHQVPVDDRRPGHRVPAGPAA